MSNAETALRQEIVEFCQRMSASGYNQGTSGNISARFGDGMLISPSASPYDTMTPGMITHVAADGSWQGPLAPSTEWRFHLKFMQTRADCNAVIHAHPTYCTSLAIARKDIPACHYMIAAFGGNSVRCGGYATYGTAALSELALAAMRDRTACLLANHGMIVLGKTLAEAYWRAGELETIAQEYFNSLQIGGPVLLSDAAIDETLASLAGYGLQASDETAPAVAATQARDGGSP